MQQPLTHDAMRRRILPLLAEAEIVYHTGRSPEELASLADIFAGDLAGEDPSAIDKAFTLHRRESFRFPTPAHIIALMPRCRQASRAPALPDATESATPGIGTLVLRAVRGDVEAQRELENIRLGNGAGA